MTPEVIVYPIGADPPEARLYYGISVLDGLRVLQDESVHVVCTSPPYFGLRDYGVEPQRWPEMVFSPVPGLSEITIPEQDVALGLENDPWHFVGHLVQVFREIHRVLRWDGTLWLNLGDSYANWVGPARTSGHFGSHSTCVGTKVPAGLKEKDLIGIPWRVALALQADGWYLRNDIIWSKDNVMPESVKDRCTRSHEHIFLLTKSKRYFYDNAAIKEPHKFNRWGQTIVTDASVLTAVFDDQVESSSLLREGASNFHPDGGRNKRDVWTVNPQAYRGAHFATWPTKLVEPMILAGSSPYVCGACASPWIRVLEQRTPEDTGAETGGDPARSEGGYRERDLTGDGGNRLAVRTVGTDKWASCCEHDDPSGKSLVLDPFSGSATTGLVALRHGRDYVGIDLNSEYLKLALARLEDRAAPEKDDVPNPIFDLFLEESS